MRKITAHLNLIPPPERGQHFGAILEIQSRPWYMPWRRPVTEYRRAYAYLCYAAPKVSPLWHWGEPGEGSGAAVWDVDADRALRTVESDALRIAWEGEDA